MAQNDKLIQKKKAKAKREHWFSPKGIIENSKKIHWLQLKNKKDGSDGLLTKFGKVVMFMLVFALLFIALDAIYSVVLTRVGIL